MVDGVTPAAVNLTVINGINWPVGILPKTGQGLSDIAIVRSVQPWALVHSLAQVWQQIGRNPAAALGDIAPNIGSVVAIEKDPERKPTQVFPTFLTLKLQWCGRLGVFSSHLRTLLRRRLRRVACRILRMSMASRG